MLPSILIDATHLGAAQPTGVESYVDALLPQLVSALAGRADVALVSHGTAPAWLDGQAEWIGSPHRPAWSQVGLAALLARRRPALFFTPSGIPPLLASCRTALTVHDLAAVRHPEYFTVGQRFRLRWLARLAARRASAIIVPSRFVAGQVTAEWEIPTERISVIPHGAPSLFDQRIRPADVEESSRFILFIGRLEAKKNLATLVAGFAVRAVEDVGLMLVLAGKPGYGSGALERQISALPADVSRRIVRTGYVSEPEKSWLLHHAVAVAVPCTDEGFGFPALESQLAGRPVIAANAGSLPELPGLVLVDPVDPAAWAEAMRTAQPLSAIPPMQSWRAAALATAETLLAAAKDPA